MFLDIGAHLGETLDVVMRPRWGFEVIYSFEPAPACWSELERKADHRVVLCRFGLSDRDERSVLYNAGAIGASTSADKDPTERPSSVCEFVDAGAWFEANIQPGDEVYAKVNIEGAEVEVVEALDRAGQLSKIDHLLIHFDFRKVPSRAHLEPEIRARLNASGVEYLPAERLFFGDVHRGTRNWLEWCALPSGLRRVYEVGRRVEGRARVALYPIRRTIASRAAGRRASV